MDSAGLYISVPFCRHKCSFCNFASGVYTGDRLQGYVDRLCREIRDSRAASARLGAERPQAVDSVYFGGGTPSLLPPGMIRQIFEVLRGEFAIAPDAEITVECAPKQVADEVLEELLNQGVNRLSFGVQSFKDCESAAVGRTHTRRDCMTEFTRVFRAGIKRIGIDLIVGLPLQDDVSWMYSVEKAIASGVEHVSVYMLEIDEDSRLGKEALLGGRRYHAAKLPDPDATVDWYLAACERLEAAGVHQYEISNFARAGGQSRHNLKYWQRDAYIGFGLDAHSMLYTGPGRVEAVRWANSSEMAIYVGALGGVLPMLNAPEVDRVSATMAFEEALFLGLRLNRGVDLGDLRRQFGVGPVVAVAGALEDVESAGLIQRLGDVIRLTPEGRVASNEVFSRLLLSPTA